MAIAVRLPYFGWIGTCFRVLWNGLCGVVLSTGLTLLIHLCYASSVVVNNPIKQNTPFSGGGMSVATKFAARWLAGAMNSIRLRIAYQYFILKKRDCATLPAIYRAGFCCLFGTLITFILVLAAKKATSLYIFCGEACRPIEGVNCKHRYAQASMYPIMVRWDRPRQPESTLPLTSVSIPLHRCLCSLHAATPRMMWSVWRVYAHRS